VWPTFDLSFEQHFNSQSIYFRTALLSRRCSCSSLNRSSNRPTVFRITLFNKVQVQFCPNSLDSKMTPALTGEAIAEHNNKDSCWVLHISHINQLYELQLTIAKTYRSSFITRHMMSQNFFQVRLILCSVLSRDSY